jgi:hypothetical protein
MAAEGFAVDQPAASATEQGAPPRRGSTSVAAAPADKLARGMRDLRISVTDRCQFRCTYCMPREVFGRDFAFLPRQELLTFEELTRLARVFAGLGVRKLQRPAATDRRRAPSSRPVNWRLVAHDPIRPAVHVIPVGQAALGERRSLGLPLGGQPGNDRGRQARARAKERLQRRDEIQAGQPVQIQQRQHLGHLRRAPTPAGQQPAVELHPLAGTWIDPPVVHPRSDDFDLADPGGDGAGRGVAVADHQPMAALIHQLGVRRDVGLDLGLQRHRQHPPGALAKQLVQVQGQLDPCLIVNHYTQHRGVPSSPALARRRPPYRSGWKVRRALMPGAHPQVPTIARSSEARSSSVRPAPTITTCTVRTGAWDRHRQSGLANQLSSCRVGGSCGEVDLVG